MTMDPVMRLPQEHEPERSSGYTTPGWYFWDETGAYCHGPFEDEEQARAAMVEYARSL